MPTQEFYTLEEATAAAAAIRSAAPAKKLPEVDGRAVVEEMFPGYTTSGYRGPNHPLTRANPNSAHARSRGAVDVRPIPGLTYDDFLRSLRAKGYSILEHRDEQTNPLPWTTGPHWHAVLAGGPTEVTPAPAPTPEPAPEEEPEFQEFNTLEEATAAAARIKKKPVVTVGEGTPGIRPAPADVPITQERLGVETKQIGLLDETPEGYSRDSRYYKDQQDFVMSTTMMAKDGWSNAEINAAILEKYPNFYSDTGNTPGLIAAAAREYRSGRKPVWSWSNPVTEASKKEEYPIPSDGTSVSAPAPLSMEASVDQAAAEMFSPEGTGLNAALMRAVEKGLTSEQYWEKRAEEIGEEQARREQFWTDQANRSTPGAVPVARFIGDAVGDFNPTYLANPGGSVVTRMAAQGAINAATDLPTQMLEQDQGLREGGVEGIDAGRLAINFAAGAAFQGASEGLAKAVSMYQSRGLRTEGFENNPRVAEVSDVETPDAPAVSAPEATPTSKKRAEPRKHAIARDIADITEGWTNSPDFVVHTSRTSLQKAEPELYAGMERDGATRSPAFYAPDGKIHVVADNLGKGDIAPVVYHEALGHSGLKNSFTTELDNVLTSLYEGNWRLRQEADAWGRSNPEVYKADPNPLARNVEEALAIRSEAGVVPKKIMDRFTGMVRKYGRQMGLDLRYTDGEVRGILADAHETVTSGESGNRYVQAGNKYIQPGERPRRGEPRAGNLNLDKLRSSEDIDRLYQSIAQDIDPKTLSHEEVADSLRSIGVTPGKLWKKKISIDPRMGKAMEVALLRGAEDIIRVQKKIVRGEATSKQEAEFSYYLTRQAALQEKLSDFVGNAARVLNYAKLSVDRDGIMPKGFFKSLEGADLSNPALLYKIAEQMELHADNPAALNKIVADAFKPLPEDYFLSFRYNMMLFDISTQTVNLVGNASSLGLDNFEHALAVAIGLPKKLLGKTDRVSAREFISRQIGFMRGATALQTYKDVWTAFKEGKPPHQVSQVEGGHAVLSEKLGPVGGVIELPMKVLASVDSLFRSFITASSRSGLAVRSALDENLKGKAFYDRVDELSASTSGDARFDVFRKNTGISKAVGRAFEPASGRKHSPSSLSPDQQISRIMDEYDEILKKTGGTGYFTTTERIHLFNDYVKLLYNETHADLHSAVLQLVDDPSFLTKWMETLKRRPTDKTDYGKRVLRFVASIVTPFSRVADRLFVSGVRRLPVLGILDKNNLADFKAGGARRDMVYARMITGGILLNYFIGKAMEDELFDDGPLSYALQAQMKAEGKKMNAIKINGEWHSMEAFDNVSVLAKASASFTRQYKQGEMSDEDTFSELLNGIATAANVVNNNTSLEQLGLFFGSFGNTPLAENNRERYVTSLVTSFVPSGVRRSTEKADGYIRDVSGTGTLGSKIIAALEGATPGLRQDLPIRHDVYGREMKSPKTALRIDEATQEDQNPVIKEIARLTTANKNRALVSPVDRGDLKAILGEEALVPSDIVQAYQATAGQYILEDLTTLMENPEWNDMSDEERIKEVKRTTTKARKDAREDLFEVTPE